MGTGCVMNEPVEQTVVLQQFLISRDIACPRCKYNLRDCSGTFCPECGVPLELHVVSAYQRLGWWLVGFIAWAVPFGFNLILAAIAGYGAWQLRNNWTWDDSDWMLLGVVSGATIVAGVCLLIHTLRRGRFLRQPPRVQVLKTIAIVFFAAALQGAVIAAFKRI